MITDPPPASPTDPYDLVIIGTGSANSIIDERMDGWRIAMVERWTFGGTCLNRGCIPSKMLIYPADVIAEIGRLGPLGVDAHVDAVHWRDIRDRVFGRIDPIAAGGEQYRRGLPNVDVFAGDARFTGDKTLTVAMNDGSGDVTIVGDRFVIGAGSRPAVPDLPGFDTIPVHTSDDIMRVDEVPRRMAVIGGGVIAVEQAHIFASFGSEVTMIVRGGHLLRDEDAEVSARFTELARHRYDLRLGTTIRSAAPGPDGSVVLELARGEEVEPLEVDVVLVATGRIPNGAQLGVEATGVELDDRGLVVTDDRLETRVPGIWALGDVRSPLQFKHVANHEYRVVQHNLVHPDAPVTIEEDVVPAAIFGSPQIASVGMTEAEVQMTGEEYLVARRDYAGVAYGWAMEDTEGFCKVLADCRTRKLLGAHIIGHQASILIQPLALGMRFGLTVDQIARHVMYPHPALSEVVENALLDL